MDNIVYSLKNPQVISFFFFTIVLELLGIILVGLEFYNVLIVSLIVLFGYLIFLEPSWGFFLLIFVSFYLEGQKIETFVLFDLYGFHWYLMDITFFLIFISISFRFLTGQYKIKFNSILIWFILFYFAVFISAIWGLKSGHPAQDVFYDIRAFFYYLVFIPTLFILEDFKKLKKVFLFLLIFATIKCTIDTFASLYFLPKGFDPNLMEYLPFARLVGYNEIVYPLTLIASINYFFFNKNIRTRIFLIPTILFSFSALILSYTRGSWLAALLTLLLEFIMLVLSQRIKLKISLVFIISFFGLLIVSILSFSNIIPINIIFDRATSISLHKVDISNLGRLMEYATAFSAFLTNPIFGAGLGYKFIYYTPGIGTRDTIYCHNSYLYVLSKMGIVGIIPFLMIVILSIKVGYVVLKSDLDKIEISVAFTLLMMFAAISFKALTTWHLNTVTFSLFVGFLFGVAILYKNKLRATT